MFPQKFQQSKASVRRNIPRRKSFTLIELLVVVAIISILASLLLPSLKSARETAKGVACLSNMKQVGLAFQMMGNDNEGWINGTGSPSNPPAPAYWYESLTNSYLKGGGNLILYNGGKNSGCPAKLTGDTTYSFGANTVFTGYGYYPMRSLNEVRNHARIFLVADCYGYGAVNPGNFDDTVVPSVNGGYVSKGRHRQKGLNFIFADGHGEFLKNGAWHTITGATQWNPPTFYTFNDYGLWSE